MKSSAKRRGDFAAHDLRAPLAAVRTHEGKRRQRKEERKEQGSLGVTEGVGM